MEKEKTFCSICKTTESKGWLGKGMGTYCNKCSRDINDFSFQPQISFNIEMLAEVFFRRGKGEEITYEELHKKNSHLKFISFVDLFKRQNEISEVQENGNL